MDGSTTESTRAEFREKQLERARQLVTCMESGDEDAANRLIEELGRMHESVLFEELGKLTRNLHEALNAFRWDSRLMEITQSEIPDAKERLNYVVAMTEQSAHRTLNAVEESLPVAESIVAQATGLADAWQRFRQREMTPDEFRTLSREISSFLEATASDVGSIRSNLSDVLMAQDFQDLTGQVIRRVIQLVQDLELNLVGLVRVSGERLAVPDGKLRMPGPKTQEKKTEGKNTEASGPTVPGTSDSSDVISGQGDVDELLSSLGF